MAVAVKEMGMSSVRSPASSEFRDTTATELQTLVTAIEGSDIVVPELAATAPELSGASRSLIANDPPWCEGILVSVGGAQVPAASWASRFAHADIDGEVLRWIASHVNGKRRVSGSLMAILGLMIGASPLTTTFTSLIDLLA
jgi:hypothetical protein